MPTSFFAIATPLKSFSSSLSSSHWTLPSPPLDPLLWFKELPLIIYFMLQADQITLPHSVFSAPRTYISGTQPPTAFPSFPPFKQNSLTTLVYLPTLSFCGLCARDQFLIKVFSFRIEFSILCLFPKSGQLKAFPIYSTLHSRLFSTTRTQHTSKPWPCMTHIWDNSKCSATNKVPVLVSPILIIPLPRLGIPVRSHPIERKRWSHRSHIQHCHDLQPRSFTPEP